MNTDERTKPRGYQIRATRLALCGHADAVSVATLRAELEKPESLILATLRYLEEDGEAKVRHGLWRLARD
jgi:hypothetical protein